MKRRFSRFGSSNVSSVEEVDAAMLASSSTWTVHSAAFKLPFAAASTIWCAMRSALSILTWRPWRGDRHRLTQLPSDSGPKIDAALGPPLRVVGNARLEPAVLGRTPIADFIVASRAAIGLIVARHGFSFARSARLSGATSNDRQQAERRALEGFGGRSRLATNKSGLPRPAVSALSRVRATDSELYIHDGHVVCNRKWSQNWAI
jgi:hypothetical protein